MQTQISSFLASSMITHQRFVKRNETKPLFLSTFLAFHSSHRFLSLYPLPMPYSCICTLCFPPNIILLCPFTIVLKEIIPNHCIHSFPYLISLTPLFRFPSMSFHFPFSVNFIQNGSPILISIHIYW